MNLPIRNKPLKSWKTSGDCHIFQVLNRRSNSYLIVAPSGNILVDTGKESSFSKLRQNIENLNSNNPGIDKLILTHAHFDHCENAFVLQKQENCQIYISEAEAEYAVAGCTPMPKGTILPTRFIIGLGKLLKLKSIPFKPFVPDVIVKADTDLSSSGVNIRLINTPGHSAGSLSVIIDNEIAIAGDAVFGIFFNSVFPPFGDNVKEVVNSWGKLLQTGCHTFLPGHGKAISRELLQRELDHFSRKLKKVN